MKYFFTLSGYSMKTIKLIQSPSTCSHRMETTSTLDAGQRRTVESLSELFELFTIFMITRYERLSAELDNFFQEQIIWLKSLDSDLGLYDPKNKKSLLALKDFLANPDPYFHECIDNWDEIMDITIGFHKYYREFASLPINRFTDKVSMTIGGNTIMVDNYHDLPEFFAPMCAKIDAILMEIPPTNYETMHENNRDLYRELNAYIMNPARIDNMCAKYGIESQWEYLDAICV